MEGNRRNFIKKSSTPQFKKKGAARKGSWQSSTHEQFVEIDASDTVYRILFQSKKIGSVIGKGGNVIKSLREETQAKIKVADSVPGSDERVVIISSPSTKDGRRKKTDKSDEDPAMEQEFVGFEPHCPAQDALLRVHDRVVEDDMGGTENGEGNETTVTVRLLVPNNVVGCLLGRKGDVIQRLRSETGASIRVLPAEHLSACAMSTDELVQIQGEPAVAKKALYQVSTMLYQNPRKDRTPSTFPITYGTPDFHRHGRPMENMPPSVDPMWSPHDPRFHRSHVPWARGYGSQPSGFGRGDFDDVPPPLGGEIPSEFGMKILCPTGKIGGVIGKGGFLIKQLELETGANVRVEDASPESDERVICVSSLEALLLNPRSQTIDAILQLQSKTSEFSEKGILTTRLLIPSSKVGCLIGQGGQVINEMRRRTQADIRVFSKKDKPKCASDDEELVQISGSIGVAKEALAEIASRLRTRCLRDGDIKAEPGPIRPVPGFGIAGNPPSVAMGPGTSGRYGLIKGGLGDYENPSYPGPSSVMGFSSMEEKIYENAVGAKYGRGGTNFNEIAETRSRLPNPQYGNSDYGMHGSSERLNAPPSNFPSFAASAGQNNNPYPGAYESHNPQHGAYESYNPQHGAYQSHIPQQVAYESHNPQLGAYESHNPQHGAYESHNPQHGAYESHNPQHGAYESHNAQHSAYESNNAQHGSFESHNAQQGAYPSHNVQQSAYPSHNAQQGAYPSHNAQQGAYPSHNAQQSAYPSHNAQQSAYPSHNAQQGAYPSISPSQLPYQNVTPQQASHQNNTPQASYNSSTAQASYEY